MHYAHTRAVLGCLDPPPPHHHYGVVFLKMRGEKTDPDGGKKEDGEPK